MVALADPDRQPGKNTGYVHSRPQRSTRQSRWDQGISSETLEESMFEQRQQMEELMYR